MVVHLLDQCEHEEVLIKTGLGIIMSAMRDEHKKAFIMRAAHGFDLSYVVSMCEDITKVYCIFGGSKVQRSLVYQEMLRELSEEHPGGQIVSDKNVGVPDYFNQTTDRE